MVNRIKGTNYTSVLNPLRNMQVVKEYFDKENDEYEYTQFLVASSKIAAHSIIRNHFEKDNIKRLFSRKTVYILVGYEDNLRFNCIMSNMDYE